MTGAQLAEILKATTNLECAAAVVQLITEYERRPVEDAEIVAIRRRWWKPAGTPRPGSPIADINTLLDALSDSKREIADAVDERTGALGNAEKWRKRAVELEAQLLTVTNERNTELEVLKHEIDRRIAVTNELEGERKRWSEPAKDPRYYDMHGRLNWTHPVNVAHLILQLQSLDPEMKVSSVSHVDFGPKLRARAYGLSMSYERWDEKGWLDFSLDVPKCLAIWATERKETEGVAGEVPE